MSVTEIPAVHGWRHGPGAGRAPTHRDRLCRDCRGALLQDIDDRPAVTSPEAAAALVVPVLDGLDRERWGGP
ncbi:MAG: hypothetical protein R3320_08895, partial [Nitriliruptorales bacterium]|nr:hypothetical protein [Nitriliruptorales bacterium]